MAALAWAAPQPLGTRASSTRELRKGGGKLRQPARRARVAQRPGRAQVRASGGGGAGERAAVVGATDEPPYPGEEATLSLTGDELRALGAACAANQAAGGGAGSALLFVPRAGGHGDGALLSVSRAVQGGGGGDGGDADDGVARVAEVSAMMVSRARVALGDAEVDGVARVARIADWPVWDGDARRRLACAMLDAKVAAIELRELRTRVGEPPPQHVWQRLMAVAPNHHDAELAPADWARTPPQTQQTWCARAEWFSFAALRFAGGSDEVAYRKCDAWLATETHARVAIALELLALGKAEAAAKASIKNAFGR